MTLRGEADQVPEREFFLYRGNAIRVGDWKYNKRKSVVELYNLADDPAEKNNLISQYPEKASVLAAKLSQVRNAMTKEQ
ncbi:MAG: hypothetical protein ACSHX0_07570 [Akkermansiaceae bacterium]